MRLNRRTVLQQAMAMGLGLSAGSAVADSESGPYACVPCGCAAQGQLFDKPGNCPACGMTLVLASSLAAPVLSDPDRLPEGRGAFETESVAYRPGTKLSIHYYKPKGFTPDSPILIVLSGAGRNADAYRDAWIAHSERTNVLIATPEYPEAEYGIADYQLGGVVKDFSLSPVDGRAIDTSQAHFYLKDEELRFSPNPLAESWLFHDFDRLFDLLVRQTGSRRTQYDLFGHSAGAQIAQRHVLFHPHSKAERIVAANAGLYALPELEQPPLLGLAGTGVTEDGLRAALQERLLILAGENDTHDQNGGSLIHTPLMDLKGRDRLERARYFFEAGQKAARRLKVDLGWRFETMADTGHDFRAMSDAAAKALYG